jgi:hypothetical protein
MSSIGESDSERNGESVSAEIDQRTSIAAKRAAPGIIPLALMKTFSFFAGHASAPLRKVVWLLFEITR